MITRQRTVLSLAIPLLLNSTTLASEIPTQVLDLAAYGPRTRIKAIAAGGDNHVSAIIETTYTPVSKNKKNLIWHSDSMGDTSGMLDISVTGRNVNFVPARVESTFGISREGTLAMSIELSPTPEGQFSGFRRYFDSMWVGEAAILSPRQIEGQFLPNSMSLTNRWRFVSRPGITSRGEPYWLGGEAGLERGPSINRSIFAGTGNNIRRLLAGGESVNPDAEIIGSNGAIDSFSISPLGGTLLAVVLTENGTPGQTEWRVIEKTLDGTDPARTLLRQSNAWDGYSIQRFYLPTAGELPGCNLPTRWAVAADLSGSPSSNSVLVVDNQMAYREGGSIGSSVLAGPPLAVRMNITNDLLLVWGVRSPGSEVINLAAFLNGSRVLGVGDTVDIDGDGDLDPSGVITYLAPMAALGEIGDDGRVSMYFSVHVNGVPALVRVREFGSPRVGSTDFNGDGDYGTDADIEAFFLCMAGTCCPTCATSDFNGDGDFGTDADIEAFFRVLAGGNC